jgi:hypothetical protein
MLKKEPVERIRTELPLEEMIRVYGIDIESMKDDKTKPMPSDWKWSVIHESIDLVEIYKPHTVIKNDKERVITLGFNTESDLENFITEHQVVACNYTNKFIESKGFYPKDFNRTSICSTAITGKQLVIQVL